MVFRQHRVRAILAFAWDTVLHALLAAGVALLALLTPLGVVVTMKPAATTRVLRLW